MRILIIGGTGLISTSITRLLLERGDRSRTTIAASSTCTLRRRKSPDSGRSHRLRRLRAQIAEAGPFDCVIDMVGYHAGDADSAVRAFRGRSGHFIFCSTVDVYLKPATRYPYTEDEVYGGLNTYSSNKVICEQTLRAAHEHGDFPLTIIRPAYTYGEGRGPLNPFGGGTATSTGSARASRSSFTATAARSGRPAIATTWRARSWLPPAQPHTFGKAYHTPGEEWMTWNSYHQRVAAAIGAPRPRWCISHRTAGDDRAKASRDHRREFSVQQYLRYQRRARRPGLSVQHLLG